MKRCKEITYRPYRLSYFMVCRLLCIRRRKRTYTLWVVFKVNMKSTTMYYYYYCY